MNRMMDELHNLEEELRENRSRRERFLAVVFYRFAEMYDRTFYRFLRRFAEFSLLIHSLLAISMLVVTHLTYINNPLTSNCLAGLRLPFKDQPIILRIEVKRSEDNEPSFNGSPNNILNQDPQKICDDKYVYANNITNPLNTSHSNNSHWIKKSRTAFDWMESFAYFPTSSSHWLETFNLKVDLISDNIIHFFTKTNSFVVECSQSPGLLLLKEKTRKKLKVPVINITLDPDVERCFGTNIYKRVFLEEFYGFKDVIILSLENYLIENNLTEGYFKTIDSNSINKLRNERTTPISWTIITSVSMAIFIIIASLLLKFSNIALVEDITLIVFNYNPNSLAISSTVVLILALAGFRDITKYMFYDNFTFTFNLLLVWAANQFYMICCHSRMSKRHWLRFFLLYHFSFYAYYIRHKGRFAKMTMIANWFFIQHSMLYFFHHYELPAMQSRLRIRRVLDELRRNSSNVLDRLRFRLSRSQISGLNALRDVDPVDPVSYASFRTRGSRVRLHLRIRDPR